MRKLIGPLPSRRCPFTGLKLVFNSMFNVPKSDGGFRTILNGKPFNKIIDESSYRLTLALSMEVFQMAREPAAKFVWKLDFAAGFRNTLTALHHMRFNAFEIDGLTFIDPSTPMGKSTSPKAFGAVAKAIVAAAIFYFPSVFTREGRAVVNVYVDDIFGFAETYEAAWHQQLIMLVLGAILGMRWKAQKVELPCRCNIVLGFWLDLSKKLVGIPDGKILEFSELVQSALSTPFIDLKIFQKILGKLNFFATIFRELRSFCHLGTRIVATLDKIGKKKWFWPKSCDSLVRGALRDFRLAEELVRGARRVPLGFIVGQLPLEPMRVWTDAATDRQPGSGGICSLFAWQGERAVIETALESTGLCPPHNEVFIVHLKWVTSIFHELMFDVKVLSGKLVCFYIDNTNAECWGRKGRIANISLTPLMQAVMIRRRKLNYKVKYLRIRSKDNIEADVLSETYLENIRFLGKTYRVIKLRPQRARQLIRNVLTYLPNHTTGAKRKRSYGSYSIHIHIPFFQASALSTSTNVRWL